MRTSHFPMLHPLGLYADDSAESADEFVIPDDLTTLSDDDLAALQAQAAENFNAIYGDGQGLSDDDLTVLSALTEGIEALQAEGAERRARANERAETAAALAARVNPEDESEEDDDADEADDSADSEE